MANRPIFLPLFDKIGVDRKNVDFTWFPGFSVQQKQRSIFSLHTAAQQFGIKQILEISSKSAEDVGVQLSAFSLMITSKDGKTFPVEAAFQSGKVFENGGPYSDLLNKPAIEAKKDPRLKTSGELIGFNFYKIIFPTKPITLFYDWLYIKALSQNQQLARKLLEYGAFTDIEFNPRKSLNCQAFSAALYVSLVSQNRLAEAMDRLDTFKEIHTEAFGDAKMKEPIQKSLF